MISIRKHLEVYDYYRDEPALDKNNNIINFPTNNNNSVFFKLKKITGKTGNDGRKDVNVMVPLIYLSNFWMTLEMPLINCKIDLILTWSVNCF